jgi:hypothetical protein
MARGDTDKRKGEKRGNRENVFGRGHNLDGPDPTEHTGGNPKGTRLAEAKARGAQGTKDGPIKPKRGGVHGAAKLARAQARKKRVPATTHTKQGKQTRG